MRGNPPASIIGQSALVGSLDTTRPTPPPRHKKLERTAASSGSLDSNKLDSQENLLVDTTDLCVKPVAPARPPRPKPPNITPVMSNSEKVSQSTEGNLIRLESFESGAKLEDIQFDPLQSIDQSGESVVSTTNVSGQEVPVRPPKPNLSRQEAFYDKKPPPKVAQRCSMVIDDSSSNNSSFSGSASNSSLSGSGNNMFGPQTMKEARTEFMMTGGSKTVFNLDPFDPLSNSTPTKPPEAQIVMSPGGNDDNLLKEWNLDFDKMKVSSGMGKNPLSPGTNLSRTSSYAQAMRSPVHSSNTPVRFAYNQSAYNQPRVPQRPAAQPMMVPNSSVPNFANNPHRIVNRQGPGVGLHGSNSDPKFTPQVNWTGSNNNTKPNADANLIDLDPFASFSSQSSQTNPKPTGTWK